MVKRLPIIAGLYAMIAAAWVYGALDSSGGLNQLGENRRMFTLTVGFLGLVHLAVGYLGRNLLLLVLPAVLVAIAVPAGDFPASRPEMPIWLWLALLSPIFVVLTGIGIAVRRFLPSPPASPRETTSS